MSENKDIPYIEDLVECLSIFGDFVSIKKEPLPQRCVLRHWSGDVLYSVDEVRIPEEGVVPLEEQKYHFCPGDGVPRILLYSYGSLNEYPPKETEEGLEDLRRYLRGEEQENVVV